VTGLDRPGVVPVDFGTAELVPDPRHRRAFTLLLDGVAQSYVDLDRPTHLEFEYMRRVASVVDVIRGRGQPLRVLHLGGGGLTLVRYVHATRPGSIQDVVERDGAVVDLVGRSLPLPEDADVRIRVADARAAVPTYPPERFDLVIGDVFHAAQVPRSVTGAGFLADAARLLRPGGAYVVNVTDLPPMAFSRVYAATLGQVFADVCLVATTNMLGGRRFGNVVFAAAPRAGDLPVGRLRTAAARRGSAAPNAPGGRLLHGAELLRFVGGARPAQDQ
jgi:spermidine synthase